MTNCKPLKGIPLKLQFSNFFEQPNDGVDQCFSKWAVEPPRGALKGCWGAAMQQGGAGGGGVTAF